jgi:hypothetical protein
MPPALVPAFAAVEPPALIPAPVACVPLAAFTPAEPPAMFAPRPPLVPVLVPGSPVAWVLVPTFAPLPAASDTGLESAALQALKTRLPKPPTSAARDSRRDN